MLSTALAGCAHRDVEPPPPATVAVDTHTKPSAELLRCPERPEGFPADGWAVMPEQVRQAVIRLVGAFARNADRHARLIEWESGKPCEATPG